MERIVEYIKSKKYVELSVITTLFEINSLKLQQVIDDFNNSSFYYSLIVEEGVVYWEDNDDSFPSTRSGRYKVLRDVWICNVFDIAKLEILFGRSRKTLYKDIKSIKADIADQFKTSELDEVLFHQDIINRLEPNVVVRLLQQNLSEAEIYCRCSRRISSILGTEDISSKVVNIRFNSNQINYQNQGQILTNDLINNIERYRKKKINRDRVFDKLLRHITNSYWRYENMIFKNTINVTQLISAYAEDYHQLSTIIKMILNSHNLFFCEEEVMYIAIYFLDLNIYQNIKVKVAESRLSKKSLIEHELHKHFKDFILVDSNRDITVSFEADSVANAIKVKVPFDIFDVRQLSRYLVMDRKETSTRSMYIKLAPLLKKSVDFKQFENQLQDCASHTTLSLKDYVKADHIQLINNEINWQEAIRKCAKTLEDEMYISRNYTDNIIKLVNKYNAEIVIAEGIALAHAPITKDVYQSGFSFLYSQMPIKFPLNKEVKLIILFCANSEVELLLALQELNAVLVDPHVRSKLLKLKNSQQLIDLICKSRKNK